MKRFWKIAALVPADNGFAIRLDDRPVNTPMRAELVLPNTAMAQAALAEWNDVGDVIKPAAMPITGFANAAIDRISADRAGFIDSIAAYGESDLFCYRADDPELLIQRQASAWDPHLKWAAGRYGIDFTIVRGVMHQKQPEATVHVVKSAVAALNDWQLSAASRIVPISGSLIALLALVERNVSAADLWNDLVVDELWQEEKWGADEYALKNRRDRQADFMDAARFLDMCA
jgi:chaperone required for assembly of F1-ATPase